MSKSFKSTKVTDKTADNVCVVCCRDVSIYAIGECDHPVCYQCATRMRVLCKQNECPICRRDLPKIYFCKERKLFHTAASASYQFYDRKYELYFEDHEVQQAHYRLIEHACYLCNNTPVFEHFNALKDHVRKVHDLFYCDICVKHLMIFTYERKSYSRHDLARHRRVGDVDDTSHRGHPLCEFCDERYLDNDELYRHLRREHFFCHFCDLDGLNHYYSDYEYLRKHFRVEHYLCEEGECLNEKFTTAFRTEIDLKAHRATAHNKGMSKAQAKQARTLELEFTIAPRSAAANSDSQSANSYYRSDESNPRRGRRGGHRDGSYHARADDVAVDDVERFSTPPNVVNAPSMIDMNSSHEFPVLGMAATGGSSSTNSSHTAVSAGNDSSSSSVPVDTLARKLAKINRFTVGSSSHGASGDLDAEFPALHPRKPAKPETAPSSRHQSKSAGNNKSWGSSGSASLSLTSSRAPAPNAGSKKTLTLKLNSQEEFPGLGNVNHHGVAPPNVSIQVSRKQNVLNSNGTLREGGGDTSHAATKPNVVPNCSLNGNSKSQPVVVTRLEGSQNITFLNPPPSTAAFHSSNSAVSTFTAESHDSGSGVPKTDNGWYVLKKGGKATKRNSLPNEFSATTEEFPALQVQGSPNARQRKETVEPAKSSWKVQPQESKNSKSVTNDGVGATNSGPQISVGKSKKKKKSSKLGSNNAGEAAGETQKVVAEALVNGDKNANTSSEKSDDKMPADTNKDADTKTNKELKRTELKIEKLSPTQEPEVPNGYNFTSIDFPSLTASSSSSSSWQTNAAPPPPGFSKIETKSTRPPPGFVAPKSALTTAVTKPPPGFGSVIAAAASTTTPLSMQSPTTPTSVTFTNSSGQNFVLPGSIPFPPTYMPPEGFQHRNADLTATLLRILDDSGSSSEDGDKFSTFKALSAKFRQAEITGAEYYERCSKLMTKKDFSAIFPELLVLLPDISKQQELLMAHNQHQKRQEANRSGTSGGGSVFLVCASCQQVLAGKDFRLHESSHSLDDNFPMLGNPVQPSQVKWMTQN